MPRYVTFKEHVITSTAKRDPRNNLFHSDVFIEKVKLPGQYAAYNRATIPADGQFLKEETAEVWGVSWAKEWIDALRPR